ncbi:hypothetical protein V2J09_010607 [Rumex salicifolius]
MEGKAEQEIAGTLQGQKELVNLNLAFIESMALKCIIELGIPDIIHSHGSPMSLSQIATKIGSKSLNLSYLSRVMRLLVHKRVFAATTTTSDDQSQETLYSLSHSSRYIKFRIHHQESHLFNSRFFSYPSLGFNHYGNITRLLHGCDMTMVPVIMMSTHPRLMEPWHQLSASIKDDENAIKKAYGSSLWEVLSTDPDLNDAFNLGLESTTKFTTKGFLMSYKDGFLGIETLVDVGGGIGYLLSEIVKAWPLIKGINFDLQHVVESAPSYPGITHVGGDMKSLRKAAGKIVLVEMVEEEELFDEVTMKLDLLMMVHCIGGKERTRIEWTKLLEDAGFSRINFIKIPTIQYIIEAYAT